MANELGVTREQIASANKTLELVVEGALAEVPELVQLLQGIKDDFIDVRDVLGAIAEASDHADSDELLVKAVDSYQALTAAIFACSERIKTMLKSAKEVTAYSNRFVAFTANELTPTQIATVIKVAASVRGLQMLRNLTWAAGLLNFFEAVRGLDRAQSALLNRKPRSERQAAVFKEIVRAGLAEGVGSIIPGVGVLVAIANSQTPAVDKQIDALSRALGTMKAIYLFREISESQQQTCEFVLQIFDDAIDKENETFAELGELMKAFTI